MLYAAFFVDEDDVGTYTIKSIDDPRTLNKTIYIRPQDNCLTHNELIAMWEKLSGKSLTKFHIPAEEFLAPMKGKNKLLTDIYIYTHTHLIMNTKTYLI